MPNACSHERQHLCCYVLPRQAGDVFRDRTAFTFWSTRPRKGGFTVGGRPARAAAVQFGPSTPNILHG